MAIYNVKLNQYSPRINRQIPADIVAAVNARLIEYVANECRNFDKNTTIRGGNLYTATASYLVINITSNFRTNLIDRNEQQFLSTRID